MSDTVTDSQQFYDDFARAEIERHDREAAEERELAEARAKGDQNTVNRILVARMSRPKAPKTAEEVQRSHDLYLLRRQAAAALSRGDLAEHGRLNALWLQKSMRIR